MTFLHQPALAEAQIAAALQWWRDAGVDHAFADAPINWLAQPVAQDPPVHPVFTPPASKPPPPVAQLGGAAAVWPQDLAALQSWWMTEPKLDNGQTAGRVPPRGRAGAALMIMIDHPEAGDTHTLLAGPHGKLIAALLSALGITPDGVYIAAVLPRHMPLPDWTLLREAGLAALACHHAGLAAPKRLISFGSHVSSLLGHDPANRPPEVAHLYHVGGIVPALAAPGLETLLTRPRGKARLWQALLDWQLDWQLD